ncbi:MAG: type II toxin-antitoxin system VapC family toxin [Rhodospirillales bacterium]
MPALVLDCSVTLGWLLADEQPAAAAQILDLVAEKGAMAPGLWPLEVGNALLVAERRGRLSSRNRTQALQGLAGLPIEIDDETAGRAWRETLALAEAHNLTLYDAAYLELALRRSLPLATFDTALRTAAVKAGVPLLAG